MNRTLANCYRPVVEFQFFVWTQVVVLTVTNSVVMVGNKIANTLIIFVLIKTKQIANNTCKLFFVLSVSDLMVGLFVQNSHKPIWHETNCLLMDMHVFIAVFLVHLSMYTIAIMGIDRYLRIKHYANFKAIWTKRVVLTFISGEIFLAFLQAIMTLIGLITEKEYIVVPVYYAIDGSIISGIVFLQNLTMRTSNAVCNESRIAASRNTDKKITNLVCKLCYCFAVSRHRS